MKTLIFGLLTLTSLTAFANQTVKRSDCRKSTFQKDRFGYELLLKKPIKELEEKIKVRFGDQLESIKSTIQSRVFGGYFLKLKVELKNGTELHNRAVDLNRYALGVSYFHYSHDTYGNVVTNPVCQFFISAGNINAFGGGGSPSETMETTLLNVKTGIAVGDFSVHVPDQNFSFKVQR